MKLKEKYYFILVFLGSIWFFFFLITQGEIYSFRSFSFTTIPRHDGFGSQLFWLISSIAIGKYCGWTYFHQPWCNMSHNTHYNLSKDQNAQLMENWAGISRGEKKFDFRKHQEMFVSNHPFHFPWGLNGIRNCKKGNSVISLSSVVPLWLRLELRERYLRIPKENSKTFLSSRRENFGIVVVHIRRGDLLKEKHVKFSNRKLSEKEIIRGIEKAVSAMKKYLCDVHIHTEGEKDEEMHSIERAIALLPRVHSIYFHFNEDIKNAFHDMVMTDALVTARSSLSYSAGILNIGVVVCFPMEKMFSPFDHWING